MIGAVTTFSNQPILSIYPRTNTNTWKSFLYELKAMLDQEQIREKVWLVIDNLSVHYAYALKKAYEPFHILFLPAYSSPLNPQEHVWATTKRELAVHFARINHPVTTQVGFEAEVDYILS